MNIEPHQTSSKLDSKMYVTLALEITEQEWSVLGLEDKHCPNVAASTNLELTAERITSLLVIRLVAIENPPHKYANLSTSCICKTLLRSRNPHEFWPASITSAVIGQLRSYVRVILRGYKKVPYHNFEHAYQVIISANKAMDIILQSKIVEPSPVSTRKPRFEEDPLMHLALLFASLIHDVEHQGIPNQQLVLENDPLALLYNDQSIAEQHSLAIGFTELLKEKYDDLRYIMFPFTLSGDGYRRFRGAVTNLVLATDISTPDRSAIVKKKWQVTFGDGAGLQQKKILVGTKERRRRKSKLSSTPKTSTTSLILKPPREHPRPNNRKKKMQERKEEQISLKRKESLESWMDFNTPSKHFPKDSVSSMGESSLSFWWFCPPTTDGKAEDCDLQSSSSLHYSLSSSPSQEAGDNDDSSRIYPAQGVDEQGEDKSQDFEESFSIFSREGVQESATNISNGILQESYHYPSSSQSFQKSFVFSVGEDESQHLLSPTKVSRLDRIVSRSNRNAPEPRSPWTPLSRYKALKSKVVVLPDKDDVQPEDDQDNNDKPKSGRFSLRSLISPTAQKGDPTKQVDKSYNENGNTSTPKPKNAMMELQSMVSRFRTIDLMSSIGTMDGGTVATAEESSMNFCSSSKLKFDPPHDLDDPLSSSEAFEKSIRLDSLLQDVHEEEEEEQQDQEPAVHCEKDAMDEELRTTSLMEHILLVADVGHTLQDWDSMLTWAFRLSQEMKCAIAAGRGCGIPNQSEDEELLEWYNNQISFLEGYVLPLATRLEQTGFLPTSTAIVAPTRKSHRRHCHREDHPENEKGQPLTFLSQAVLDNCNRWKQQGMDILVDWKNNEAKKDVQASRESLSSINSRDADPWCALKGENLKQTRMSFIQIDDCLPSRG